MPEELAGRLRRGEPAAFEALVRSQAAALLLVARQLLGDEEQARAAVRSGFRSAAGRLQQLAEQRALASGLRTLVVQACLAQRSASERHDAAAFERLLPSFLEDGHHAAHPADWSHLVSGPGAAREQREPVRACVDRLPEPERAALLLHDGLGLELPEVARALELEPSGAKTCLQRARQALRSLLSERLERSPA